MSGKPCRPNCVCGRHSAAPHPTDCTCAYHRSHVAPGSGIYNFLGGAVGAYYAELLCPLGYERHVTARWGLGRYEYYELDFALRSVKINIELDGRYHDDSNNSVRDARLRSVGWKVIRIRHANDNYA